MSDEQIIDSLRDLLANTYNEGGPGTFRTANSIVGLFRSLGWTAPDEWEEEWSIEDDVGTVHIRLGTPLYRRRTEGAAE